MLVCKYAAGKKRKHLSNAGKLQHARKNSMIKCLSLRNLNFEGPNQDKTKLILNFTGLRF